MLRSCFLLLSAMSSADTLSLGQDNETGPSPSCWMTNDCLSIRHSVVLRPILPVDVFEEVINQSSNNAASLRHLSLTCSTFLPRARYHLFSDIEIKTKQQLENSVEFLESHPWLSPLIRRVVLRINIRNPNYGDHRKCRLLDAVPVHLFSLLPNLHSWRIGPIAPFWYRTVRSTLSFHHLTISCYRRYAVNIQTLEVSYITLVDNISDFARFVSAFTNIQSLTCSFIDLTTTKNHNSSELDTSMHRIAQTLRIKHLHVSFNSIVR